MYQLKLISHPCPSCGANLEANISNETNLIYCHYCGCPLSVEDSNNIKISINTTITDTAEVIRAKTEEYERKNSLKYFMIVFIILVAFISVILGFLHYNKKEALQEGKITAGNYSDLVGKDFKTVEAHFEAAGFTNIELIDLNDSLFKEGEVDTISIGGNTNFESVDYFYPDTKVVISYH